MLVNSSHALKLIVELFFPVNIAVNKPTFQSSTYEASVSSRAVDGNRNTDFSGGSCSHTRLSSNPWWAVDLQCRRQVASVSLTNRNRFGRSSFKLFNFVLIDLNLSRQG